MSATQDYVALDWIKGEISQTLEQAQHALEAVAESPDDSTSMRSCLTALHQIHGTLTMVELAGPAQVADEMEKLAQALMNSDVPEKDNAQEVLMQSILQMPAYLDRLQREQKDSESNYLPMANNLRAARGEEKLAGSEEPEQSTISTAAFTTPALEETSAAYLAASGPQQLPKLEQRYRHSFAALVKKEKPREQLSMMGKVFMKIHQLADTSPLGNMAQLGLALVEGTASGAIKLNAEVAKHFRAIDTELVRLSDAGDSALSEPIDVELTLQVFETLNNASKETAKIVLAKKLFAEASGEQLEQVSVGPDDETLAAVARILIEEIKGITDKLDLYVRSNDRDPAALVDLLPGLEQVASTLTVVGLVENQSAVDRQIEQIRKLKESGEQLSEDELLDMAKDLLEIEATLGPITGDTDEGGESDSFGDLDDAQTAVVRETRAGLARCKDSLIEFVTNDFNRTALESLPEQLTALRGGLLIVDQQRSGDVLVAASSYVKQRLLDRTDPPELSEMDDLADAITSIDYYLERLMENARDPYVQMLEVAEAAVEKLTESIGPIEDSTEQPAEETKEQPVEPVEEPETLEAVAGEEEQPDLSEVAVPETEQAQTIAADDEQSLDGVIADEVIEPAAEVEEVEEVEELEEEVEVLEEPQVTQVEEQEADDDTDLIDDEILEIFVEEVDEVLETLAEYFPLWRANSSDTESLAEVRRAFHTLKGSGRMVGATVIGELAWSVENMLNRVIDNSITVSDSLVALIEEVLAEVPAGMEHFKNQDQHAFQVDQLVSRAEALAAGEALQDEVEIAEPEQDTAEIVEPDAEQAIDAEQFSAADQAIELEELEFEDEQTASAEQATPEVAIDQVESLEDENLEDESLEGESSEIEDLEVEGLEVESLEIESLDIEDLEIAAPADDISGEVEAAAEDLDTLELESFEPEIAEQESIEPESTEPESTELDNIELGTIELESESIDDIEAEDIQAESAEPESIELDSIELDSFEADSVEPEAIEAAAESDELETDDFDLQSLPDEDFELDVVEESEATAEPEAPAAEPEAPAAESKAPAAEPKAPAAEPKEPASAEMSAEDLATSEDLELDDIFIIEANERIEVIKHFLDAPQTVDSELVAAFHTLKGSSAMAEIPSVAEIAAPLEQLCNQYLTQNQPADSSLIERVAEGLTLLQRVIADLPTYRNTIDGSAELVASIQGGVTEQAEPAISFDFENIQRLSEEQVVPGDWHQNEIDILVLELTHAKSQAQLLNQVDLQQLIEALLRVYQGAKQAPIEADLRTLKTAHEALVAMFDQVAASQTVEPAAEIISLLDHIELDIIEPEEPAAAEIPGTELLEDDTEEPATTDIPSAELAEDDIDDDVLPIFLEEAEDLLEELDDSIQSWSENSADLAHLDNVLRLLHTVKGGARMAGANSLGEFAHNLETFLISLQQNPVAFDSAFFTQLLHQQDEITRRVEIYQKIANNEQTEAELQSLRTGDDPAAASEPVQGTPQPAAVQSDESEPVIPPFETTATKAPIAEELPADEIDDDVLPIFLEESEELLEGLEQSIQGWSENPGSSEYLDNLLRHLHTLKGGARMAGANSLGEFAHNFETILIGVQQNPVEFDAQFFAMVNQRQDEIARRVEIYQKLINSEATPEELASLTKDISSTPETAGSSEQKSTDEPAVTAQEPEHKTPAAQSAEMVRVSSDLMEELISLAGESSITRGRVEQQISDFGDSLQEMEDTIRRIRDQVRRLEIEAESRETLIRSQAQETDSTFDDLELDRYTMLQEISRTLNESSSDMLDLRETLVNRSRDAETLLHQQARIGSELQEGLTRTRMVPFSRLIPRLRRIVRQISAEINKSVRFDAFNIEGELDRTVLEKIVAPLEHMLRNAVDHGIESAEQRVAAGKAEEGRISLRLSREGGYVILTVSDDGGGINVEAVRKKAVERGLIGEDSQLSDQDIMQFILDAGFSTAEKLTQISGRGVGMDVVVSEIKALGGSITIDSTLGVGTEFTIRIPFTVSINRALMVVIKEETYAVPLNTIEGIVRVSPYELEAYYQPDAPMFEYAGQPYRLDYLGRMLSNADAPNLSGQVAPLPVILARSGDSAIALQVDRVIGSREVVVKTLGPQFNEVGGIAGATVLGDGRVVIILDLMALVRSYDLQLSEPEKVIEEVVEEPKTKVRTVMIVDDSVTVRKVTTRLMERQGWQVETAKDGVDAIAQLQDIYPDVVLLDIEMPKMDGFEVLRTVRNDERLKNLPIIMITSRTGEKHKQQALDLGVNKYLGKPFQEANLLATIEEVLSETT